MIKISNLHNKQFYANVEWPKWPTFIPHEVVYLLSFTTQDIDGKLCIICPKHKYKISLAKGEGIYKGTDPREKPPVPRWYSKGVKQRVHTVTETNGDVYVKLSENTGWMDSDYYQGEKGKVEREKAEAAEKKKSWQ